MIWLICAVCLATVLFHIRKKAHFWYQDLNESGKDWFHFRGSVTLYGKKFGYSLLSEAGLGLEFIQDEDGEFTIHIHFIWPAIWIHLPIWRGNKELSFSFHDWTFWWTIWMKKYEWHSEDPWWRHGSFCIPDFLFGQMIYFQDHSPLNEAKDVYFEFRGKTYMANEIKFYQANWFRSRIPFALCHQTQWRCDIKIDKPPMRAGKGENSWDCEDDGLYGMCFPWEGSTVRWTNQEQLLKEALAYYCESVSKDIKKYGKAKDDKELSAWHVGYKYLGRKVRKEEEAKCAKA